jgi:hypothetical protein
MHNPTPEQQSIIDHVATELSSHLMVSARAGAAKTSTIVMAAEHIPASRNPLAVAFNKRIADELTSRLPSHFTCKTLNALGHAAWTRARNGKPKLDTDKMYNTAKLVLAENMSGQSDEDLFTDVLNLSRKAKSIGLVPLGAPFAKEGVVPDTDESWQDIAFALGLDASIDRVILSRKVLLASIASAFKNEIDFDDQIYMSVLFGGQYARFGDVFVDESQDLSTLNHMQLERIVGKRLIAVGDPFQAIYAFRGADAQSMSTMKEKFSPMVELNLTKSFRVPFNISRRQTDWVPDFDSMPFLGEGEVQYWPKRSLEQTYWSLDDIPQVGAILCRNNAPLMRMAFALIKARRPVKVLGRDIGASLASVLEKACGRSPKTIEEVYPKLDAWKQKELAKANGSESKLDVIHDRFASLMVLIDASLLGDKPATNHLEVSRFIRDLFSDREGGPQLVLSSGHRAKGFEWEWVMHLDPFRVPSSFAQKQEASGNPGPMVQEKNLRYVIETRSKDVLVLANLSDCQEVGGEE